ncbi:MAG: glycosyltransferase [Pseudomonadota bacterium]
MPYAVDNGFFQAQVARAGGQRAMLRAQLGLASDRPVILFAGKLIARKRPFDALNAFATLAGDPTTRSPYLLFAGDGELRPALEASIARRGLDGARVLGFQNQTALAALYDLADLLVLPSERESWGAGGQ